jgi:hypothetical protein
MYDTSACSYSSRLLFVVLVPVATLVSLNGDALVFFSFCTNRAVSLLKVFLKVDVIEDVNEYLKENIMDKIATIYHKQVDR